MIIIDTNRPIREVPSKMGKSEERGGRAREGKGGRRVERRGVEGEEKSGVEGRGGERREGHLVTDDALIGDGLLSELGSYTKLERHKDDRPAMDNIH